MNWYSRPEVRNKILSYTQGRETAFIHSKEKTAFIRSKGDPVPNSLKQRNIRMDTPQLYVMYANKYQDEKVNWYYSLAKYRNGLPYISNAKEWNKEHWKHMIKYDFFIDIDCKSHDVIKYGVFSVKQIIRELKDLNPEIRFSGRGFHIVIDGDLMPRLSFNPKGNDTLYMKYLEIARYLYEKYSEQVDTRIYDSRRVIKIPYSLSWYGDEAYICKPVPDIDSFDLNDYRLDGGTHGQENSIRA